jgi:hypothetical protein
MSPAWRRNATGKSPRKSGRGSRGGGLKVPRLCQKLPVGHVLLVHNLMADHPFGDVWMMLPEPGDKLLHLARGARAGSKDEDPAGSLERPHDRPEVAVRVRLLAPPCKVLRVVRVAKKGLGLVGGDHLRGGVPRLGPEDPGLVVVDDEQPEGLAGAPAVTSSDSSMKWRSTISSSTSATSLVRCWWMMRVFPLRTTLRFPLDSSVTSQSLPMRARTARHSRLWETGCWKIVL